MRRKFQVRRLLLCAQLGMSSDPPFPRKFKAEVAVVRRAFEPILKSPVTILDADRPIGTHVFTAMERTNGETNMRWRGVSLDGARGGRSRDVVV
jgi:hypothetical protein